MTRAFHSTHTTDQTHRFFDHRTVINYSDCTRRTGFLTDSTANAADFTLFLCFRTFFLIGTFYYNVIGAFMDVDYFLWTYFCTGPAADTFLFIYFCYPIFIDGNGSELHLFTQALQPIQPSAQPVSPSADLHPPLHATTADLYGNFFFTAIFTTSFHMVFQSEADGIVSRHPI